jgi:hypothetical protein
MKKSVLRLLATTLIFAIIIGAIVACIGWLLRWHSTTQFSNAMFWSGAILIGFGLLSVMGGYLNRSSFGVLYSQSAGDMSMRERTQRWVTDATQGYSTFIFFMPDRGVSGRHGDFDRLHFIGQFINPFEVVEVP